MYSVHSNLRQVTFIVFIPGDLKVRTKIEVKLLSLIKFSLFKRPVAQLVEHRVVKREVVSSTPAGPTLRVLK